MRTLLGGKYRVLDCIGQGGMGVVHAGVNVLTERFVAIKFIHAGLEAQESLAARFEREARAAGRIESPHVVQILDIDRDDRGQPFIVMERLRGETLHARRARGERLPLPALRTLARQLLLGIAAAHEAGVVHRDLKPANVFLERLADGTERVKILDFGLSAIAADRSDLTRPNEFLGTLRYMAPEQLSGEPATEATDQWAIGVVLYDALSGVHPFGDEDRATLMSRVLSHSPRPLGEISGVDEAVARAFDPFFATVFARPPSARFPSAAAMLSALDASFKRLEGNAPSPAGSPKAPPPGVRAHTVALATFAMLGALVGMAGSLLSKPTPARPPAGVTVELDPPTGELRSADLVLVERTAVPLTALSAPLTLSAPGFVTRSIDLPARAGAYVVVGLAPDRGPSAAPAPAPDDGPSAAASAPQPSATPPSRTIVIRDGSRPPRAAHPRRPAPTSRASSGVPPVIDKPAY